MEEKNSKKDTISLTQAEIDRGMRVLQNWVENHPDRNANIILAGDAQDCWSPQQILDTLKDRLDKGDRKRYDDIPESILISASKAKE